MSGADVFAAMQPEYARHGIATFPVWIEGKDKRPAVTGYAQIGLQAASLAAAGFQFQWSRCSTP